jgi:hypothetical protein
VGSGWLGYHRGTFKENNGGIAGEAAVQALSSTNSCVGRQGQGPVGSASGAFGKANINLNKIYFFQIYVKFKDKPKSKGAPRNP